MGNNVFKLSEDKAIYRDQIKEVIKAQSIAGILMSILMVIVFTIWCNFTKIVTFLQNLIKKATEKVSSRGYHEVPPSD